MKTLLLSLTFFFPVMLCLGQWDSTHLSEITQQMGGASLGTKAYFAGGVVYQPNAITTNKVEIYDVASGEWQIDSLSNARKLVTGVVSGSKVFFAGGTTYDLSTCFSTVDIFDTLTQEWSVEELLIPRFALAAESKDSIVLFAGGTNPYYGETYNVVDIYNTEADTWTTASLSVPRSAMGSTVVGDLAIFAGGFDLNSWLDDVDIYNFTTGTWSTATLSQARGFIAATTVGNKALFAGGMTANGVPSNVVDMYDYENDTWTTSAPLSVARGFYDEHAVTIDGRAYFVGGGTFDMPFWITDSDVIDIYDEANDEWSAITMTNPLTNHSVAAVGATMLIAGGFTIVEYPYGTCHDLVEIFMDLDVGVEESAVGGRQFAVSCYPNPTGGISHFSFLISQCQWVTLKIYNAQGQEVAVVIDQKMAAGEHTIQWNASGLPAGIYYYRLTILRTASSGHAADRRPPTITGKIVKL